MHEEPAIHEYNDMKLSNGRHEYSANTYPIHHRFAALGTVLHLLIVAIKHVACLLDEVPTVRHDELVLDHVEGGVLTKILPRIELIKYAFVVLAAGLIGAGDGAEPYQIPRVDEAHVL
jgi:hypothetical protein